MKAPGQACTIIKDGPGCDITCLVASGNDVWLGDRDGGLTIRDVITGDIKLKRTYTGVRIRCFTIHNHCVWIGLSSGVIEIHHSTSYNVIGEVYPHLGHNNLSGVVNLISSDKTKTVFASYESSYILQWDSTSQNILRKLRLSDTGITCMSILDSTLFVGSSKGIFTFICDHDLKATKPTHWCKQPNPTAMTLSDCGRRLWTGHASGNIFVWGIQSQLCLAKLDSHKNKISSLVYIPDRVWASSWDGTVSTWGGRSYKKLSKNKNGTPIMSMSTVKTTKVSTIWSSGGNKTLFGWSQEHDTNLKEISQPKETNEQIPSDLTTSIERDIYKDGCIECLKYFGVYPDESFSPQQVLELIRSETIQSHYSKPIPLSEAALNFNEATVQQGLLHVNISNFDKNANEEIVSEPGVQKRSNIQHHNLGCRDSDDDCFLPSRHTNSYDNIIPSPSSLRQKLSVQPKSVIRKASNNTTYRSTLKRFSNVGNNSSKEEDDYCGQHQFSHVIPDTLKSLNQLTHHHIGSDSSNKKQLPIIVSKNSSTEAHQFSHVKPDIRIPLKVGNKGVTPTALITGEAEYQFPPEECNSSRLNDENRGGGCIVVDEENDRIRNSFIRPDESVYSNNGDTVTRQSVISVNKPTLNKATDCTDRFNGRSTSNEDDELKTNEVILGNSHHKFTLDNNTANSSDRYNGELATNKEDNNQSDSRQLTTDSLPSHMKPTSTSTTLIRNYVSTNSGVCLSSHESDVHSEIVINATDSTDKVKVNKVVVDNSQFAGHVNNFTLNKTTDSTDKVKVNKVVVDNSQFAGHVNNFTLNKTTDSTDKVKVNKVVVDNSQSAGHVSNFTLNETTDSTDKVKVNKVVVDNSQSAGHVSNFTLNETTDSTDKVKVNKVVVDNSQSAGHVSNFTLNETTDSTDGFNLSTPDKTTAINFSDEQHTTPAGESLYSAKADTPTVSYSGTPLLQNVMMNRSPDTNTSFYSATSEHVNGVEQMKLWISSARSRLEAEKSARLCWQEEASRLQCIVVTELRKSTSRSILEKFFSKWWLYAADTINHKSICSIKSSISLALLWMHNRLVLGTYFRSLQRFAYQRLYSKNVRQSKPVRKIIKKQKT